MFVCQEDGEAGDRWPKLIGWTTLNPELDRQYVVLPERREIPRGILMPITDSVTLVEFALRTVYVPGGGPGVSVVMLADQDPTILPGWDPRQDRVRRVFARRGTVDFPLQELSHDAFARWTSPHRRGMPMVYCLTREGIPRVAPAPAPEYEIVIDRHRMFSFEPPLIIGALWDRSAGHYIDNRVDALAYREMMTGGTMARPEPQATLTPEMIAESVRALRVEEDDYTRRDRENREQQARLLTNIMINPMPAFDMGAVARRWAETMGIAANMLNQDPQQWPRVPYRDVGVEIGLCYALMRPRVDPETAAASRTRARGLLKSLLRPEQWAEFERTGTFSERIGEDLFTLNPGGMIERGRGDLRERWCVNPDPYADGNDFMPVEDMAIGQLLYLRAGPDKVRAAANIFPVGAPVIRDRARFAHFLP